MTATQHEWPLLLVPTHSSLAPTLYWQNYCLSSLYSIRSSWVIFRAILHFLNMLWQLTTMSG